MHFQLASRLCAGVLQPALRRAIDRAVGPHRRVGSSRSSPAILRGVAKAALCRVIWCRCGPRTTMPATTSCWAIRRSACQRCGRARPAITATCPAGRPGAVHRASGLAAHAARGAGSSASAVGEWPVGLPPRVEPARLGGNRRYFFWPSASLGTSRAKQLGQLLQGGVVARDIDSSQTASRPFWRTSDSGVCSSRWRNRQNSTPLACRWSGIRSSAACHRSSDAAPARR